MEANDGISDEIRQELLKFENHIEAHCLACGYVGYFGCVKKIWPWYFRWWAIILLMPIGGLGALLAMTRGFISGAGGGYWKIECPNCHRHYETK